MATTFEGSAIIEALVNVFQGALNNKVNTIDVAAETNGIRIKNAKFAHKEISPNEIESAWADMNEIEWCRGITGKDYNPTNGSPIVLFNNTTNEKIIIACEDYNATDYPTSIYIPIGIIVIPKYHTGSILGSENAVDIMMSLKHMNYNTPNTGGSVEYIYWGGYGADISELFNYTKRPIITNSITQNTSYNNSISFSGIYEEPTLIGSEELNGDEQVDNGIMMAALGDEGTGEDPTVTSSDVYIPSDKFSGTESQACPGTYYNSYAGNYKCPSPFLVKNGVYEPNPAYYEKWNESDPSVTSDFKGKENTQIICSKITVADWQTVSTITNSYSKGNYPAAACCWRYSTPGTAQGDWYLPAAGEIGYLMPFFAQHNKAITKINDVYGAGTAVMLNGSEYYLTSSEYNSGNSYRLYTSNGNLAGGYKRDSYYYAIAFCELA